MKNSTKFISLIIICTFFIGIFQTYQHFHASVEASAFTPDFYAVSYPVRTTVFITVDEFDAGFDYDKTAYPKIRFAQLVTNGGFEAGNFNGWRIGGVARPNVYPNVENLVVHSGTYAAFLGDVDSDGTIHTYNGDSYIYQDVEIPSGSSNVKLTFWYYAASYDEYGDGDWIEMQIKDVNNNNLATPLFRTFDGEVHGPWTEVTYNLDSFVGQTIRLYFNCHDDGYYYYDWWGNRVTEPTAVAFDDIYIYYDPETVMPTSTHALQGTLGNADWYVSDVNVVISASDADSGVDKICYKIDTEPVVEVYASSTSFKITDNGIHTLEYYAVDKAGNEEQPHNFAEIKIDKIAPTTTYSQTPVSPDPTTDWYGEKVKVTLTADDNTAGSGVAEINYKIDTGTWQIYTGEFELPDGIHTVWYKAIDIAGNEEQPKSKSNIKIDTLPPVTNHKLSGTAGNHGWYVSGVNVELKSTDNHSGVAYTNYKFQDEDVWRTYDTPIQIDTDGIHTLQYYSVDNVGNAEKVNELIVKVDMRPPEITRTETGTYGVHDWYLSDVTVKFNVTDFTAGINYTEYSINDAPFQPYVGEIKLSESGEYEITFIAVDMAGNSITNITYIKIDKIPPKVDYKIEGSLGENNWYRSDVKITLTSTDNISGAAKIWYKCGELDINLWLVYEGQISIDKDGIYVIEYYATDIAGNWCGTEDKPLRLEIKIDKTAPAILHKPIKECSEGSDIKITASIYDSGAGIDVNSVKLWYRCPASTDAGWRSMNMSITNESNVYEAIISPDKIKGNRVEYYIEAQDLAGNSAAKFSRSAPQNIDIIGPNWALLLLLIPILFIIFLILILARRRRAEREAIEPLRAAKLEELARRRRERGGMFGEGFSGFGGSGSSVGEQLQPPFRI